MHAAEKRFSDPAALFQFRRCNSSTFSKHPYVSTLCTLNTHTHTQQEASSSSSSLNLHIASFIKHYHHRHNHRPTLHSGHTQGVCMYLHRRSKGGVRCSFNLVRFIPSFPPSRVMIRIILNICPNSSSSSRCSSFELFFPFVLLFVP